MSAANSSSREPYQFAAEPKPVKSRSKYRAPNDPRPSDYEQLQNDPRIRASGPVNLNSTLPNKNKKEGTPSKISPSKVPYKAPEKEEEVAGEENITEPGYVPLDDRSTDDESRVTPYYYIDRPPTPEFKPLEPGIDVATQVEDVELFDFKLEVEPVLEVLVGKTLEQAQLELCEEDDRLEQLRHRMRFEKQRNAELMVTQRKEALHLRKQDEKKRREKQYAIETQQKALAHQKYIARILAKNVTFGMKDCSINVLASKGVLCYNLKNEMKKDYIPCLIKNTVSFINENTTMKELINNLIAIPTNYIHDAHAKSVQKEFDRRKKIADDKKAEEERLAAEKQRRRERRRKLRLYFEKEALLNKIQTVVLNKFTETDNPFNAEITDVFPSAKESVATIGGLLGELCMVLENLQGENETNIKFEQIVEILVDIFMDKYKQKEFPIYLSEKYQQGVEEINSQMSTDLITFNQNKSAILEEFSAQLEEVNLFQNLGTLHSKNLLNHSIFKMLNQALLNIYFTSVDYKIPEKKVKQPEQPQEEQARPQGEGEQPQGEGEQQQGEGAEQPQGEPEQQQAEGTEVKANLNTEAQEEEEFKLPEITALEQAMVQAKKKLKLVFVKDWEFNNKCDAIVRFRTPLDKEIKPSKDEIDEQEVKVEKVEKVEKTDPTKLNSNRDKKKNDKASKPVEVVVEEPKETVKERAKKLMENEDYIEPFDGSTYEKEKLEFPLQPVPEDVPTKIYNMSLVEGKYIAQINERSQGELRKELVSIIKSHVPEWKEVEEESLLAKIYLKYKANEKAVFETLISNPEVVPIFDIQNV